jgi:hypothetical protein
LCLGFATCSNIHLCAFQSELARRVPTKTSRDAKWASKLGRKLRNAFRNTLHR